MPISINTNTNDILYHYEWPITFTFGNDRIDSNLLGAYIFIFSMYKRCYSLVCVCDLMKMKANTNTNMDMAVIKSSSNHA